MKKNQTIPEQIWQFFCSVKLAVYTLVLIAATSILGTIILQDGSRHDYLRLYGKGFSNVIHVFNLDDMYHAWWFLLLLACLCINIVVCSINRLSITWKIIFPEKVTFNPARFKKLKNLETFSKSGLVEPLSHTLETFLSRTVGSVIKQKTQSGVILYAEKGRWTRIGIYVVHFSILLLVIGAVIGSFFGFKATLKLDEGQTSDSAFIQKKRLSVNMGFSIRCNDFDVKFYDTGAPEEFKSNLTIIENGKESFTKDILVNHPLRYKGINIFQSSYGTAQPDSVVMDIILLSDKSVNTQTIKISQQIKLPGDKGTFTLQGFMPHFDFRGHNLGDSFIGKITRKDGKTLQIMLPVKFPTFDKMRKGTFAFVIKKFKQKYYTGLQITKDPGIWYVYSGFIFMIIGCWVTFFMSHQSYFIEIEENANNESTISISGISNRNRQGMKLKIKKMALKLKDK